MDHDTASNAIVCSHFPDIHITYCSNHSAKSFHYELNKIKSLSCKCKKESKKCKRITEALIDRMKTALLAGKPQEYITTTGKVTTNAVEGFHGLALKYRGKRIDFLTTHYCCKTNMAVCHKNLGPIWKLICLCEMGVDIPEDALSAILNEQKLWDHSRERRNQSEHYHYRSLRKQVVHKRHATEKKHMVTLRAVGCTTAEYVGSSAAGTAEASGCTVTEERDVVGDEVDQPSEDEGEDEEVSADVNRSSSSDALPLLFFFDCESTGGSTYNDHIIEAGAKVVAVPSSVSISQHHYGSLIHSSQNIAQAVQKKCGITTQMLVAEPPFRHVLEELYAWINSTVQEVEHSHALKYYPVLVAHNGFVFDFLILLSELHRRNIPFDRLAALHFADTLYDCKKHAKDSNSTIFTHWDASEKKD